MKVQIKIICSEMLFKNEKKAKQRPNKLLQRSFILFAIFLPWLTGNYMGIMCAWYLKNLVRYWTLPFSSNLFMANAKSLRGRRHLLAFLPFQTQTVDTAASVFPPFTLHVVFSPPSGTPHPRPFITPDNTPNLLGYQTDWNLGLKCPFLHLIDSHWSFKM